jgi:hypothetical protein
MKLYKADILNQIGNKIITVPTDSQFLIGLSTFDPDATIKLFDGATEIQAEEDKVNAYTCFRFSTGGTPFRKLYTGVVTGANYSKTIDILVICEKLSIAYRDLEGGGGGSSVDIVTSIDSESTDTQIPSAKCVYTNVSGKENASNKVTSIDSTSTDSQYPSAKCVYDIVGDIETLINAI